jgi:hypothetical protein
MLTLTLTLHHEVSSTNSNPNPNPKPKPKPKPNPPPRGELNTHADVCCPCPELLCNPACAVTVRASSLRRQGYLYKKGGSSKISQASRSLNLDSTRRRYFVLRGTKLYYFKAWEDFGSEGLAAAINKNHPIDMLYHVPMLASETPNECGIHLTPQSVRLRLLVSHTCSYNGCPLCLWHPWPRHACGILGPVMPAAPLASRLLRLSHMPHARCRAIQMRANGSFSLEVRKMRLIGVTRFVTRMLWLRMMQAADDCDPERTAALQAAACSWYPQRRECGGANDGLAIGSFGEYCT